jgi:hypothetical protein
MKSPRLDRSSKLSESLIHQLNLYALGATAAGVGVLALASPAEGKVIYQPAHVNFARPFGYCLDFNFGVKRGESSDCDFLMYIATGEASTFTRSSGFTIFNYSQTVDAVVSTAGRQAVALRAGSRIGPGRHFVSGRSELIAGHVLRDHSGTSSYWLGQWANGGKGLTNRYLGLKFEINHHLHYGWARVSVRIIQSERFYGVMNGVLTGYAWETIPNKSIIAGKTSGPDVITLAPASLGQLARGAARKTGQRKTANAQ